MEYHILSKGHLSAFELKPTPEPTVSAEPDLLLEMTFSPKLFIAPGIAEEMEQLVTFGVEWLDARVDCSPSQPPDEQLKVYENYRMPYIHQAYRLTDQEKQHGRLNWMDAENTEFDFSRLDSIPLEERLIFKLEEDYGLVFIHQSVIDLLKKHVNDVWVRDV
ncbi:hypothetical protein [Marinobacter zhejiangensis]|uniref:Uncharacterized protein n=1 Tax=Marinobacter zhejiangensis TaxID=488535 RepID=A0A1I4P4D7_9GAMM|nr:hypothetical protein [Marinobacter zhejiangensis]SFM22609.1 hypothetical protein SAMN04487963_1800 [Marinobacter zhejiangensis]